METKQYANRDIMGLDRKGNHYCRHLMAMTAEGLHSKSEIAAELAWRDAQIERLEAELQNRSNEPDMMASDAYHHCADMIEPYLGDQCGPDTLIPSVCESMQFLIGEWRNQNVKS